MTEKTIIALMARTIAFQQRNPRYFGRRSLDKTCGEVIERLYPGSPLISDKTQRLVRRFHKGNWDGERRAIDAAEQMNRMHLARTLYKIARGEK